MKINLKNAAICACVLVFSSALAAYDGIRHDRAMATELRITCSTQPHLEVCKAQAKAAAQVRFYFNGKESTRNFVAVAKN